MCDRASEKRRPRGDHSTVLDKNRFTTVVITIPAYGQPLIRSSLPPLITISLHTAYVTQDGRIARRTKIIFGDKHTEPDAKNQNFALFSFTRQLNVIGINFFDAIFMNSNFFPDFHYFSMDLIRIYF